MGEKRKINYNKMMNIQDKIQEKYDIHNVPKLKKNHYKRGDMKKYTPEKYDNIDHLPIRSGILDLVR